MRTISMRVLTSHRPASVMAAAPEAKVARAAVERLGQMAEKYLWWWRKQVSMYMLTEEKRIWHAELERKRASVHKSSILLA